MREMTWFRPTIAALGAPRWFDGGDANDDGKPTGLSPEDVQKKIDDAVSAATSGLRANRDELLEEKKKLREQLDGLRDTWGDLDPESVKTLMTRIHNDEETRLIAEGKIDEVISRRTDALRRDLEAKLDAAKTKLDQSEATISSQSEEIKRLVVDAEIRTAAMKIDGFQESATSDAVLRARTVFTLDDNHQPVARDAEGVIIMGKDGRTAQTPSGWLEGMLEECPHWRLPSQGGGSNGSGGERGTNDAAVVEKMSSRDKLTFGMREQAGE